MRKMVRTTVATLGETGVDVQTSTDGGRHWLVVFTGTEADAKVIERAYAGVDYRPVATCPYCHILCRHTDARRFVNGIRPLDPADDGCEFCGPAGQRVGN